MRREKKIKAYDEMTNPMPRVPPVTSAVLPWSDHLLSFMPLSFGSAIFASDQSSRKQKTQCSLSTRFH